MTEHTRIEAQDHDFEEVDREEQVNQTQHLLLKDLKRVVLGIDAVLGKARMTVREVLELQMGSVIHLDKMAGEMTDIMIDDLALAKGEIVVIGDDLHVRIAEVIGNWDIADESTDET